MRQAFPNDFAAAIIWQPRNDGFTRDLGDADIGAGATFLNTGLGHTLTPANFQVALDSETLYEIFLGPFKPYAYDNFGVVYDGCRLVIELWIDDGSGNQLLASFPYTVRRDQTEDDVLTVPSVSAMYFSPDARTVGFGVSVKALAPLFLGPDINEPLPAPVTTSSASSTTTTEARDTNLGNYAFDAKTNRRYRVMVSGSGVRLQTNTANSFGVFRIRDGGVSTPTTSSTLVGEHCQVVDLASANNNTVTLAFPYAPGGGQVTLSLFYGVGTGSATHNVVGAARSMWVEDITPVGSTNALAGFAGIGTPEHKTPAIFGVRPIAVGSDPNITSVYPTD